ncbi:MAG: c-type cytochrome [Bryobacteraceae bacterium]
MTYRWLCFCFLAAVCAETQDTPAQTPDPLTIATPTDIAAGKRVFDSQCALCHGIGGTGGRGPALTKPKLRKAANGQELIELIVDGAEDTGMPAFWFLGERPIFQVSAYVRSLSALATTSKLPGNVEHGNALFKVNGCAACHSTGYGPDLSEIGAVRSADFLRRTILDPATSVQDGFAFVQVRPREGAPVSGIRVNEDTFTIQLRDPSGAFHSFRKQDLADIQKDFTRSPMPSYRDKLPDTGIDDLVAWLSSLKGKQ